MGMYTEIVVRFSYKPSELTENDRNILEYLFNPYSDKDFIPMLPEHEFFKCCRWEHIGRSCSFYHHPNTVADFYHPSYNDTTIYVFNRSDLKNYDSEIEKFFDWLNTLPICEYDGDYLGYSLYEEDKTPTIYHRKVLK